MIRFGSSSVIGAGSFISGVKALIVSLTAQKIGVSTSKLTAWKNGSTPSVAVLILISEFFDVSIDYLIYGKDRIVKESEQAVIKSVNAKEQRLLNAFRALPLEEQFCFIGKMEHAAESYNSAENVG